MTEHRLSWAKQVLDWYKLYNRDYLDERLSTPQIVIDDSKSLLGSWNHQTRIIRIAYAHLAEDPWLEVMATLRHEMAHQYAHEVLGAAHEAPHGAAMKEACRMLRVSPRATATRGPTPVATERERHMQVIQKLLSLGESPNENEAAAAIRKARHLLVKHNISLVDIDKDRSFRCVELGEVKSRHQAHEYSLGTILKEFFFVEVIWAASYDAHKTKSGSSMQVYGSDSNLEMAAYVHSFLSRLIEDLWRQHKKRQKLRSNSERRRYLEGILSGFRAKLRAQEKELAQEEGLVWTGDPQLREFYRWVNPSIRSRGYGTQAPSASFAAGYAEGKNVTLRRPLRQDKGSFGGYLGS